jgi:hypothetical protein
MIVRLPLRLALFNGSGWPNLGVASTVGGTLFGFDSVDPFNSDAAGVLFDGSDVTYVQMVGDSVSSQGCGGQPGGSPPYSLGGRIPTNSAIAGVTFSCRLRKSFCDTAMVSVFRGVTSTPELAYIPTFQVTGPAGEFQDYSLVLAAYPLSALPGTPWAGLNYSHIDNGGNFGFVVWTDCPSGGSQTIDVSEAFLDVDVTPPTPVVTTGAAQAAATSVTLNGTVNPNQSQTVGLGGSNGNVSLLFPVSWQFYFGASETDMTAIGSPQGEFICGPPNNNATPNNVDHPVATSKTHAVSTVVTELSAGTVYFYALAAICDGTVTMGATRRISTPLLDPSIGAY